MYQKRNRISNEKNFFEYIFNSDEFTITDVATNLKITFPTAKNIIEAFLETGIVIQSKSKRIEENKRKAQLYFLDKNSHYSIGIKVELEKIQIVLVNLKAEVIKESIIKNIIYKSKTLNDILTSEINDFLNHLDITTKNKILGIGISLPGTVDKENLIFMTGTNLNVYNINLSELKNHFGYDVFIENEANAGAIAEKTLGVAKNVSNFIFISINSGIGGGFYFEDKLYEGSDGIAGEIGHMEIMVEGKECNCGGHGCLELFASEEAFIKQAQTEYKDINSIDEIFAIKNNNEIEKIIDNYLKYLSIGIKNLLMIFNPEKIIIGGRIAKFSNLISKKLSNNIYKHNSFYSKNDEQIIFSKFEDNANLYGASLLPIIDKFL